MKAAFNAVFAVSAIVAVACLALAIGLVPRSEEMRCNTKARAAEHEELVGRVPGARKASCGYRQLRP
jgi:hypothetical protein